MHNAPVSIMREHPHVDVIVDHEQRGVARQTTSVTFDPFSSPHQPWWDSKPASAHGDSAHMTAGREREREKTHTQRKGQIGSFPSYMTVQ